MPALTDSPDYRQGFRERVRGAPTAIVVTSSQCSYVPFTALPASYQGHRVALVLLDKGDTDYQSEKAHAANVG